MGQWYEQRGDYERAKMQYMTAVQRNGQSLPALNNLAWLVATCPDDAVRDGTLAVKLANRAVEVTRSRHPGLLDTLAAGLAEIGRFAEAERTASLAAEQARQASQFNLAGEIEARAALYRIHQRFRHAAP